MDLKDYSILGAYLQIVLLWITIESLLFRTKLEWSSLEPVTLTAGELARLVVERKLDRRKKVFFWLGLLNKVTEIQGFFYNPALKNQI